jgi:ankyrin repeat protein
LQIAAQDGRLDILPCLVEELGADVNLAVQNGTTPLISAAVRAHMKHPIVR